MKGSSQREWQVQRPWGSETRVTETENRAARGWVKPERCARPDQQTALAGEAVAGLSVWFKAAVLNREGGCVQEGCPFQGPFGQHFWSSQLGGSRQGATGIWWVGTSLLNTLPCAGCPHNRELSAPNGDSAKMEKPRIKRIRPLEGCKQKAF